MRWRKSFSAASADGNVTGEFCGDIKLLPETITPAYALGSSQWERPRPRAAIPLLPPGPAPPTQALDCALPMTHQAGSAAQTVAMAAQPDRHLLHVPKRCQGPCSKNPS